VPLACAGVVLALCQPVHAQVRKAAPPSESERVADYLQAMGLRSLLIDQLTARLKVVQGAEKERIVERLGKLYASAIADAKGAAARAELVAAAEKLLNSAPQAKAFELKINLLRERYLVAEDAAERARLRAGGDSGAAALAEAMEGINAIRPRLEVVLADLARREQQVQAALDNNPAADAAALELELADVRRWRSTASYYLGWSSYYAALLTGNKQAASDGVRAFALILQITPGQGMPQGMSTEPFQYEHVARAAAGTALCMGVLGKDVEALAWLDALRQERGTHESIAGQWLAWRVIVLAGAGRWSDIDRNVREARKPGGTGVLKLPEVPGQPGIIALPTGTARVIASLALEEKSEDLRPTTLAIGQLAVGDLVVRREIGAVLEIARRFGAVVLGDTGFVAIYVRGHQMLDEAQQRHAAQAGAAADEPSTDPAVVNAFSDAARVLLTTGQQPDVGFFTREFAQATLLAGRATFMAGRLRDAAELFARASERFRALADREDAQEALWLAIGTLSRASRAELSATDKAAIDERLGQLSELFIREYPQGDRAATLALGQLMREDRVDEGAVRVLQSVPRGSALYEQTRRQLAKVLYRLYRAAPAAERAYASARFLRIADELLAIDQTRALGPDKTQAGQAAERMLLTARQMLDALLSGATPDATRAEGVLDAVDKAINASGQDASAVADELTLRRIQLLLAKGDVVQAERLADELAARARDAQSGPAERRVAVERYHVAVRTALLQDAERRLNAVVAEGKESIEPARRVVKHGLALLEVIAPERGKYAEARVATVAGGVAGASAVLWRQAQEQSARDTAMTLDRAVLAFRPGLGSSLQRLAVLSESAGDMKTAGECWRTLASGLPEGAQEWFQAKFNSLRVLATADPVAATTAIRQHLVLHPTGPSPWHEQIIKLAAGLGVSDAGKGTGGGAP